jgi:hypothetical protein
MSSQAQRRSAAFEDETRIHLARIEAKLDQLLAGRGARDEADRHVVATIGLHVHEPFCVAAVMALANVAPALRDALEAADVDNGIQLGKLLARVAGQRINGWMVTREDVTRAGVLWSVTMRE